MKQIGSVQLVNELKILVKKEKALTAEILRYLREVEERKLHLARGYSSLFAFCRGELGYSEAESHVRIQAMRLMKAVPEVEERIEKGELSLTVAAQAQGAFKREAVSVEERKAVVEQLVGTSAREAEKKLAELYPKEPEKERAKAVNAELTRIEFNASQALVQKLEKLKALMAHKNFSGRYDLLFEELAEMALKKLEPKEPEAEPKAIQRRKLPPASRPKALPLGAPQVAKAKARPRSRHIPAATKRLVWKRDGGRCQYQDPLTRRLCAATHGLQFDHKRPFTEGGSHAPENLRLLCAAHNRWRQDWD